MKPKSPLCSHMCGFARALLLTALSSPQAPSKGLASPPRLLLLFLRTLDVRALKKGPPERALPRALRSTSFLLLKVQRCPEPKRRKEPPSKKKEKGGEGKGKKGKRGKQKERGFFAPVVPPPSQQPWFPAHKCEHTHSSTYVSPAPACSSHPKQQTSAHSNIAIQKPGKQCHLLIQRNRASNCTLKRPGREPLPLMVRAGTGTAGELWNGVAAIQQN